VVDLKVHRRFRSKTWRWQQMVVDRNPKPNDSDSG
jgi:hypothetical protein